MDDLVGRHGSAKHPQWPAVHERLAGVTDETVEALGKLSEALEVVEAARGMLYQFHRLSGTADRTVQDAVDQLRRSGHDVLAEQIDEVLVGRNVVDAYWTFEIVQRYDAQYWTVFRSVEESARRELGVPRHCFEAEMKADEQGDHGTSAD